MKKVISLILCAALLAGFAGCVSPAGVSNGNVVKAETGRYMEQVINVPIPEGYTDQYIIGISPLENGIEVFTNTYSDNGDDSSTVHYYRHTILDDGTVKTADEPWLNALATDAGNEMRVLRTQDGALYMFYGGFTADYQMQAHFLVSHDDGKTGEELTGDGISKIGLANSFGVLTDGSIAYSDYMNASMGLLDSTGNFAESLEGETAKISPRLAASGSKIATITPGGTGIRVTDCADGTSVDFEYPLVENTTMTLAFAPDGALYLSDSSGLYRHTPDGTLWEKIMDGGTCNLGLPSFYPSNMTIRPGTPDDIYISDSSSVFRYWYDPTAPAAASEEINIFSLHENETIQQAVVGFNRSQTDVLAVYKVAMGQDANGTEQDYIKALNTELLAQTGPDILVLDGLPVDSYVQKGILAELSNVLSSIDPLLSNVQKASETADGKIYAIPTGIRLPLAYADKDTEAIFSSIAALADACEASVDIPLLSNAAFNYEMLAETMLRYYGDDIRLNSEGAVNAFLANIGRISKAIGATAELGEGWEVARASTQEEMLYAMRLNNSGPQIAMTASNRAKAALLSPMGSLYDGMLSLAATEQLHKELSGIRNMYQPVGIVGINRASQHLDAATNFLKTLLSYDVQSGNRFADQFPVSQKALEEILHREDNSISSGMWIDETFSIQAEWPVEAVRNRLLTMIEQLNVPVDTDNTFSDMLVPLIVAYLDGSDTLETAQGKMESMIATYLAE